MALTFDDGPHLVYTDPVLDLLDRVDVKATFLMVGSAMERAPGQAMEAVQRGHELGNHSFTHRRPVLKSPSTIRMEVDRADSLIQRAGQGGVSYMAPPLGSGW